MLAILILFSVSSLELNGVSIYLMPLFFIQLIFLVVDMKNSDGEEYYNHYLIKIYLLAI